MSNTQAFERSLLANIEKLKQTVNDKCYKITIELFLSIVRKTPSPTNKGHTATGLLVNQWYPKASSSFSSEVGSSTSPNGSDSIARILALKGGKEFLGKNGTITMANNLDYAYNAEVLGWPRPEWSGRVGPYRMVALSIFDIAARYK